MNDGIENPIHILSLNRISDNYCVAVRERLAATTNATRSYLDIIDINIFDYIQGTYLLSVVHEHGVSATCFLSENLIFYYHLIS